MSVANQIRTWMRGSDVAEIDVGGETLDVVVRAVAEAVDDRRISRSCPSAATPEPFRWVALQTP